MQETAVISESYATIRILKGLVSFMTAMTSLGRPQLIARLQDIVVTIEAFQAAERKNDHAALRKLYKEFDVQISMLFRRVFIGLDREWDELLVKQLKGSFMHEDLAIKRITVRNGKIYRNFSKIEKDEFDKHLNETIGLVNGLIKALNPQGFRQTATIVHAVQDALGPGTKQRPKRTLRPKRKTRA
jgi:hypothetical protein